MRLRVKNYQNVVDADIDVRGLTILRGQSDAGKSSILKGVIASMTNRFSPANVRFGQSAIEVFLKFNDSDLELRVDRTANSTVMTLGGQSYSKIGRKVPDEVSGFLNLGFMKVLDNEAPFCLNFFPQFQKPLLLEFSQKKIAEILSTSSSLDDFNLTWGALQTRRTELAGSFKHIDSVLSSTKNTVSSLREYKGMLDPYHVQISEDYYSYQSACEAFRSLGLLSSLVVERSLYLRHESESSAALSQLDAHLSLLEAHALSERLSSSIQHSGLIRQLESHKSALLGLLDDSVLSVSSLEFVEVLSRSVVFHARVAELESIRYGLLCDLDNLSVSFSDLDRLCAFQTSVVEFSAIDSALAPSERLLSALVSAERCMDEKIGLEIRSNSLTTLLLYLSQVTLISSRIDVNAGLASEGACPFCGNTLNEEDMNSEELKARRAEVAASLEKDRQRSAVLKAEIDKQAELLGIVPDAAVIAKKKKEINAEIEAKSKALDECLEKVRAIERELSNLSGRSVQSPGVNPPGFPATPGVVSPPSANPLPSGDSSVGIPFGPPSFSTSGVPSFDPDDL